MCSLAADAAAPDEASSVILNSDGCAESHTGPPIGRKSAPAP